MRIYSMTATFGKLEHETLTLKPGLNIITAPNEWGKSTWCGFLAAMLFGLETRVKSTKTTLADKERFAPWSGAPMAGRMDINWNGRDITIERSTKRRVPLGEFRAYETESGLPVEELTAANCGEMLLGVEQSVFRRAGFIRQNELPVTQDEALRRRLNALVTTGDESGAADALAASLRDLKNKCRYNRSGLLPQAEQERAALESRLDELDALEIRSGELKQRLEELKAQLIQLQNHRQSMAFAQAETVSAQAAQSLHALDQARREYTALKAECEDLPSREEAEKGLRELRELREIWNALQAESRELPQPPPEPHQRSLLGGLTLEEAQNMVEKDAKRFGTLTGSKMDLVLLAMGVIGLIPAAVLLGLKGYLFGALAGAASLLALAWGLYERLSRKKQVQALIEKYGTPDVTHWADPIRAYQEECRNYDAALSTFDKRKNEFDVRVAMFTRRKEALCGDQEPETMADRWQRVGAKWDALAQAQREVQRAQAHWETINAMVREVEKPAMEDSLTCSEAETARLLTEAAAQQQHLQNRLGQIQGTMANLGDRRRLEAELAQKNRRITRLEETYAALTLAQETLEEARTELQRRFAPRITRRAQELMTAMTDGRYHSLTMGTDFSLQAGAGQEDVLHDAIWRSDGTLDQLYLALRLAVAEELTPNAPLILDDALVRFDDERMAAAVEILKELAENRQIILFSCQSREAELIQQKIPLHGCP